MKKLSPQQRHWRANLRFTSVLLLLWGVTSFGVNYFARELDFNFFGWPFSYWMAAQGGVVIYGLLIAAYAWYLNRLDRQFGVDEDLD